MNIVGGAAVLRVSDLDARAQVWQLFGESQGRTAVAFVCASAMAAPVGGGAVAVFCDEVDQYCAEIRARGAVIKRDPTDEPYGIRDFVVSDLDGNLLTFGCSFAAA